MHLRPIAAALRNQGCDFALIMQGKAAFTLQKTAAPLIALVGDDLHSAMGLSGFDGASLRQLVSGASAAAVISSGPEPHPYQMAATNAMLLRQNVVIVETRPEREIEWIKFLKDAKPEIGLLVCGVREARA